MANYLQMPKKQHVLTLLELGWTYRRIEAETGVRRETVSRYDRQRQANAAKTFPGSDGPAAADGPAALAWAQRTVRGRGGSPHDQAPEPHDGGAEVRA